MQENLVYTIEEIMDMLRVSSPFSIYRAAKKYRETQGRYGIPSVQLNGPGSRVIFPKPMVDRWMNRGKDADTLPRST